MYVYIGDAMRHINHGELNCLGSQEDKSLFRSPIIEEQYITPDS